MRLVLIVLCFFLVACGNDFSNKNIEEAQKKIIEDAPDVDAASVRNHIKSMDTSTLCYAVMPVQSVEKIFYINDEDKISYNANNIFFVSSISQSDPVNVALEELFWRFHRDTQICKQIRPNDTNHWAYMTDFECAFSTVERLCGKPFVAKENVDKLVNLNAIRDDRQHEAIKLSNDVSPSVLCNGSSWGDNFTIRCY